MPTIKKVRSGAPKTIPRVPTQANTDEDAGSGLLVALLSADVSTTQAFLEEIELQTPGYWRTPGGKLILAEATLTAATLNEGQGVAALQYICGNYGVPVYKWESEDPQSEPLWPLDGAV